MSMVLKASLNKVALSCVGLLIIGGIASAATPPKTVDRPRLAAVQVAEPGKMIIDRTCQSCHDLGTVTDARHTAKEWPGVVARMRANGADLTDAEAQQVRDYLIKAYAQKG